MGLGVEKEKQGRALGGSGKRDVHPGPARGSLRTRRWRAGGSMRTRLPEGKQIKPGSAVSHLGPSLSPAVGWAAKGSGFLIRCPTRESASRSLPLPHPRQHPPSPVGLTSVLQPHRTWPSHHHLSPTFLCLPGWPPGCHLAPSDLLSPAGTHSFTQ